MKKRLAFILALLTCVCPGQQPHAFGPITVTTINGLTITSGTGTLIPTPSVSGQSGKFLTTNGSVLSWGAASGGVTSIGGASGVITLDTGLSVSGNALSLTLPALFATQSAANPSAGTFTILQTSVGGSGGIGFGTGGFIVAAGISDFWLTNQAINAFASLSVGKLMVSGTEGYATLSNVSSLGGVTGGARIGAISGQMYILDDSSITGQLPYLVAVPSTAGSSGRAGMMAADASFLYICTATNTWKRVAISSW